MFGFEREKPYSLKVVPDMLDESWDEPWKTIISFPQLASIENVVS